MVEITNNEDDKNGAKIIVVGVGGAGNNVIDRMIEDGISGVEYLCVNTDSQQLRECQCKRVIQIGEKLTKGRGAGANPEIGRQSAEESREAITEEIKEYEMIFITCGMGGGTGTGASPVIAQIAKEMGILTVAVVSKPAFYEGNVRKRQAEQGIVNLSEHVDTMIVIPNDKLYEISDKDMESDDAFKLADTVLRQGVQGITDMITHKGKINLDFADICSVMRDKGVAHLGIGSGSGDDACLKAIQDAIQSPLLDTDIQGADNLIVHFKGRMKYKDQANALTYIQEIVGEETNIYQGYMGPDENDPDTVYATIIATGIKNGVENIPVQPQKPVNPQPQQGVSFINTLTRKQPYPAQGSQQGVKQNPIGYKPFAPVGTKPMGQPGARPVTPQQGAQNRMAPGNGAKPGQASGSGRDPEERTVQVAEFVKNNFNVK